MGNYAMMVLTYNLHDRLGAVSKEVKANGRNAELFVP